MLKKDKSMKQLLLFAILQFTVILTSTAQSSTDFTDGFPVPDELLIRKNGEIEIFDTHSFDHVWFKNKQINAVLIVCLGTDLRRTGFYLFKSNFLDTSIVKQIDLYQKNGDFIDKDLKYPMFKLFVDSAVEINKKYFTSNRGVSLGLNKGDLLRKYKKPDKIARPKGLEVYYWDYKYDTSKWDSKEELPKGMGVHMTMFFQLDKLVAMIIIIDTLG
jgi:hypothetical protein